MVRVRLLGTYHRVSEHFIYYSGRKYKKMGISPSCPTALSNHMILK